MRRIDTYDFRRATRTTAREINRQIALNLVRVHQPISRAELARRMGVDRSVATLLVNELLADGLVREGATRDTPRGRKPRLLYTRTLDRLVVAVDVRFSRTMLMLSDFGGGEIALETLPTPATPAALVAELAMRIPRLLAAHGAAGTCEGVGLVVPGMVDRRSGVLLHAPTLGWRNVDLRALLAAELALPVHIERDAVACALAQMWLGQRGAEGLDNFVYLVVSDGVGAGLVVHGQVVRGEQDTAGEFGHIPLSLDGPYCSCGARGCWEAYASNLATLARYLGRELRNREAQQQLLAGGFSMADLIGRARGGDAAALAALRETGRYLGAGMGAIINTLNPARIIVGGELTDAWELVAPAVREAIAQRAMTDAAAATPISLDPDSSYPRLRGATALVIAPLFAAPAVA